MIGSNSKKMIYVSSLVVLLIIISVFVLLVRSGNTSPQNKQRAKVVFTHEAHTEYASDCMSCHHKYEDGDTSNNTLDESELEDNYPDENVILNMVSEEEMTEVKCASCHDYEAKTNSQEAFHGQCIGCHENDGGPLMCAECHINSNTASDSE